MAKDVEVQRRIAEYVARIVRIEADQYVYTRPETTVFVVHSSMLYSRPGGMYGHSVGQSVGMLYVGDM